MAEMFPPTSRVVTNKTSWATNVKTDVSVLVMIVKHCTSIEYSAQQSPVHLVSLCRRQLAENLPAIDDGIVKPSESSILPEQTQLFCPRDTTHRTYSLIAL